MKNKLLIILAVIGAISIYIFNLTEKEPVFKQEFVADLQFNKKYSKECIQSRSEINIRLANRGSMCTLVAKYKDENSFSLYLESKNIPFCKSHYSKEYSMDRFNKEIVSTCEYILKDDLKKKNNRNSWN